MDEEEVEIPEVVKVRNLCNDAAPLVVNGGAYIGCRLEEGHEGQHYIEIWWK